MALKFSELWFRDLSEKEKEEFHRTLSLSPVFKRLEEILISFEREVTEVNRKDYDTPGWSHKQAHFNGELAAYRKILNLLRPKERKE